MTHGNEHLQVKINRLNSKLCVSNGHTTISMTRFSLFCFCLVWFSFKFGFVLGEVARAGDREVSRIRVYDGKSTNNKSKKYIYINKNKCFHNKVKHFKVRLFLQYTTNNVPV